MKLSLAITYKYVKTNSPAPLIYLLIYMYIMDEISTLLDCWALDPVVRRTISVNPGLNF